MIEPFELTSPVVVEPKRNYQAELKNSRSDLANKMVELRASRLGPSPDVILTARFLIYMGLPARRTKERTIRKSARLANGQSLIVTFAATEAGIDLPFGSDINMLHWLVNRAIQSNSAFISWETAQEYMTWAGLKKGGKTVIEIRERFERIAAMSVTIQTDNDEDIDTFRMPIVRSSRLPKSVRPGDVKKTVQANDTGTITVKKESRPRGLCFDEAFFQDFIAKPAPMLKALLVLLSDRPQLQQYIGFLGWRSYAASSATLIPWSNLKEQVWYTDTNESRMKQRFKEAIQSLRIAWPEIRAEARKTGLWIAPPIKGVQLIPNLPGPSRQVEPSPDTAIKRLWVTNGERTGLFSTAEIAGVRS